jgi:hypothetical protein
MEDNDLVACAAGYLENKKTVDNISVISLKEINHIQDRPLRQLKNRTNTNNKL